MKQGTEVLVSQLPDCDMCRHQGYDPVRKARYDAAIRGGGWMNLCTTHFREYAYGLGTGRGQKLVVRS